MQPPWGCADPLCFHSSAALPVELGAYIRPPQDSNLRSPDYMEASLYRD
jgi:hypothetical protein